MNKRMVIMLASCAIFFGAVFGFKLFGNMMMNQYFDNMPTPPASVTSFEARADQWVQALDAVGTVKAINGVNITTETSGVVSEILFESGDAVEQGDIIVKLDAKADEAQLRALQAAAKLAKQELDRYQRLFKQGSVSRAELDRKRSEEDQAEATALTQKEMLAHKIIRAPFSGTLGIRQVDLGEYVSPGNSIVTLQSLDPVYVNFSLPEKYLGLVNESLRVRAMPSAIPGEVFTGEITAVEPGIDPVTRNFDVQSTFENEDIRLRPGMFAKVEIQLADVDKVVVIPRTAISFNPYGNAVYVIQEKETEDGAGKDNAETAADGEQEKQWVVSKRFVKTGRHQGDLVAITKGLEPGEKVVTSGLLKLRNGMNVVINNDVKPAAESNPNPDNS